MKKLLVAMFLLANLGNVQAGDVLFTCKTNEDVSHSLERDPLTNTWSVITVKNGERTEEKFHATRIGISSKLQNHLDKFTVELYFNRTDHTFTVGVNQRLSSIDGYVKELKNGNETNYRECTPRSFSVDYSEVGLFRDFTEVD